MEHRRIEKSSAVGSSGGGLCVIWCTHHPKAKVQEEEEEDMDKGMSRDGDYFIRNAEEGSNDDDDDDD